MHVLIQSSNNPDNPASDDSGTSLNDERMKMGIDSINGILYLLFTSRLTPGLRYNETFRNSSCGH